MATIRKFNVGLGTEKFTNDDGVYQGYDAIYFPIYMPKAFCSDESSNRIAKAKELK